MCEECAVKLDVDGLCEPCASELAELDRIQNVPARERIRRFGLSVRSAFLFVAILIAVATPIALSMRSLVDSPLTPEEFARFRYAAAGTFETPDGVNALSTVLGASVYWASAQEPGHEAKRLIDEYAGDGYGGFRAPATSLPVDVFAETGQPTKIDKVIVRQQPGEALADYARVIDVYAATASSDGPWQFIGRFELTQTLEPQKFELDQLRDARWLLVRFVANHGGDHVTLGEFSAFVPSRGPLGQMKP
ncbi:MAG: hypothetical protein EPO26_05445 [Chloroflexota bacterium]|nr:MAG: hypothetical protein EPO26_05445 [Chloroflexota bacterium]